MSPGSVISALVVLCITKHTSYHKSKVVFILDVIMGDET